jgi:hypothetical protein
VLQFIGEVSFHCGSANAEDNGNIRCRHATRNGDLDLLTHASRWLKSRPATAIFMFAN